METVLDHHNSKQVWDGQNWVKVPLCDNACRNTAVNFGRGIGILQCYDNQQEYKVVIHYHEFEQDTVNLCGVCLKELKKSARKQGYRLEIKRR